MTTKTPYKAQGRAALLDVLAQVAESDPSISLAKQSPRERSLAIRKQDLGELIGRPVLDDLLALAQKAAKNPDDAGELLPEFIRFLADRRTTS